ncbi:hypothetical protein HX793_09265 [Pseudomonas reactans]|uniref:hypothetical protein n=1 Tax=Pseudomonas reactans TaxID=117680 RepID=UPI0015C085A2|nr:hypothetical protein [Pseudomonas reactans]NWD29959.1 hypothetical protein [Pseudomonas reactans]
MRFLMVALMAFLLAGCGHKQLDYTAVPPPSMDRQKAIAAVEQGFYEDWNTKNRPQSVVITDQYILLADGVVSDGSSFGSAAVIGGGAIAASNSRVITREMGQRIYISSIGAVQIYQHKIKANRFVVIVQELGGAELRKINVRSLSLAQQFADAIAYLKAHRT